MTGQTTTQKARLSPSGDYYKVHGENLRNQTSSRSSNKPSKHRYHHQPPRSHNTPPTSPPPFAWITLYSGTPFKTPAKNRYYLTPYFTRPPSLTYTTTPTLQPSYLTTTLTTTMTPLTLDHPSNQHDTQHTPPMVHRVRNSTPSPSTKHSNRPYPKHAPAIIWMGMRRTRAPH